MVRVEMTVDAARELLRSVETHRVVLYPGPKHERYGGPEWTYEDEALAPGQRWQFAGSGPFEDFPGYPPEVAVRSRVGDFEVMIFSPPTAGALRIHLVEGVIRIDESDA
jgi:hypothetical protein